MLDFTGKCALITGASGGIGGSIARLLHANGATLGLTACNGGGGDSEGGSEHRDGKHKD